MSSGDTAFMLVASALVMFMTPGLALFYGGLVRSKNVLATMMQSFICLGLITALWFVCGYSLAFGSDVGGVIGNLSHLFLNGVGTQPGPYAKTIPGLLFCTFQLMFAVITPALITGAFAERMKFSAFVLFCLLWTTVVYLPVCHWIWGGGWLSRLGVQDFAGGIVIHVNAGVAALAAALVIGKRRGWPREAMLPHNLPTTILGAGILWFGWFGFNAGSALSAGSVATLAFFNTQAAAAIAALLWIFMEKLYQGKATTLGAVSGCIAGLAAVTPAAGFVSPASAVAIGAIAGILCYLAVQFKTRWGYDDALDVVAVHGVGGLWGSLAVGLLGSAAANPAGADGLLRGSVVLLGHQAVGIAVVVLYSFVVSLLLLKIVDGILGLRVSEEGELQGLDLTDHSETGYSMI